MNLEFDKRRVTILYVMYVSVRLTIKSLVKEMNHSNYSNYSFLEGYTLVTNDLLDGQNKSVKSGTVDIRLEFKFKENVPAKTIASCFIIHDHVIKSSPMSNVVRKII